MHVAERRTERNHVQMRIFLEEEAAFQAGVDGFDFRFLCKELFVSFFGYLQDSRIGVRRPTGIAVAMRNLGSGEQEGRCHLVGSRVLARLDRAALAGADENRVAGLHLDRGQVGRGFNQSLDVVAHTEDTVRASVKGINQSFGRRAINHRVRTVCRFHGEANRLIDMFQLIFNVSREMVQEDTHRLAVVGTDADDGVRFAGDGIAQVSAVDRGQDERMLLL